MVSEQLDIHMQKTKHEHLPKSPTLYKNWLKMNHKFKCSESVKLLEKKTTGENL